MEPSSYPYSPPPMPTENVLVDMIRWYATMEVRQQLSDPGMDWDLMSELMEQVRDKVRSWRPATELQVEYCRWHRELDWMVWSTVSAMDESLTAIYTDPDDCLEPWAIDIKTLPSYQGGWPTWIGKAEEPVNLERDYPWRVPLPLDDGDD